MEFSSTDITESIEKIDKFQDRVLEKINKQQDTVESKYDASKLFYFASGLYIAYKILFR